MGTKLRPSWTNSSTVGWYGIPNVKQLAGRSVGAGAARCDRRRARRARALGRSSSAMQLLLHVFDLLITVCNNLTAPVLREVDVENFCSPGTKNRSG